MVIDKNTDPYELIKVFNAIDDTLLFIEGENNTKGLTILGERVTYDVCKDDKLVLSLNRIISEDSWRQEAKERFLTSLITRKDLKGFERWFLGQSTTSPFNVAT